MSMRMKMAYGGLPVRGNMKEPVKMTRSGDVLKDEKGIYAECSMCKGRVEMTLDKATGDMSGTCKCGCRLDADKECIWGVKLVGKGTHAEDMDE
jgi:hypothetical protein